MLSSLTVLWPAGQQGTWRCALLGSGAPSAQVPRGWFSCGYSEMNRTRCLGHSEELVGTGAGVAAAAAPPVAALVPVAWTRPMAWTGLCAQRPSLLRAGQTSTDRHGGGGVSGVVISSVLVPSAPASVGDRPHSSHVATDSSAGFSLSQSPCSAFWTGGDRVGSPPGRVTETAWPLLPRTGDCCFVHSGPRHRAPQAEGFRTRLWFLTVLGATVGDWGASRSPSRGGPSLVC